MLHTAFLFADSGIPMIALAWPLMLILLVPVVVIEGFLCKKWLKLTTWNAMKSSAVANLVSTIVGVPLAWMVMLGVEYTGFEIVDRSRTLQNWHSPIAQVISLLLGAAWIGPTKKTWLIPAAILVLLVPFFLASYAIEYLVMKFMVGTSEGVPSKVGHPRVRMAVRNANLITYGLMFAAASFWLALWSLYR